MKVTRKILEAGMSINGGWNCKQLQALGEDFRHGWQRRLIGSEIPDDKVERFLSLKDAHLKKKGRNDAIHKYFGLSYVNYLVLPRSVLQSMPSWWQNKFVRMLNIIPKTIDEEFEPKGGYQVEAKDEDGEFIKDSYSDYERGRRKLKLKGTEK